MKRQNRVAIVGGGLAGLSCAARLCERGIDPVVFEASDGVGGRVRTDRLNGFLLDRGFQVYLSAYPRAGEWLDLEPLQLRSFRPGALVHAHGSLHRLMDVFRCPGAMLETVTQPIGSLRDKLLIGWLRMRLERQSAAELAAEPEVSTEAYLRSFGFSEAMIDQFFRPFYGGVFLERGLATSSRRFTFIFKMFSQGAATLPAQGMEAIPRQMASRLPNDSVRTGCLVREVRPRCVTLSGGERHEVSAVVVATDGATASQWLPGVAPVSRPWRSVSVIYFAAPSSPLREPILALNGERRGRVNHVCVPSDVAPSYAPPGKSLVSVSVLGVGETGLVEQVRRELRDWFGSEVERWTHLRSYAIPRALPWEGPGESESTEMRVENGVFVCGDHCSTASIEGAIGSGLATAEAVAEKLRPVL